MKIPFSPPDIGDREIEEVVDTLKSGWITTGPKTKQFEKELAVLCRTPMAVCLNSQTAAAEMTLRLLEIGSGDEVILPAYTYTATCSVVLHVGAKPVLIDCAPNSCEMDYARVAQAITRRTKAIIPVDLGGVMCNYERLSAIVAQKRDLFQAESKIQAALGRIAVVADSAHGLGASRSGKMSGELADFTTFSFHAVKNLTTGEGGAVVWNNINGIDDGEIYKQYMQLSLHGQTKDALSKSQTGGWQYDVVAPHYKCNMADIAAALGIAQLERYSGILKRRSELIRLYDDALTGAPVRVLRHRSINHTSSGHLYLTFLDDCCCQARDEIIEQMASAEIACNVHYTPLPMLTAYRALGWDAADFPNACNLFRREITLPLYNQLSDEQARYVAQTYLHCIKTASIRR